MNSKLAKKFRTLLKLRTAGETTYLKANNGVIFVDPKSPKGTYKRIKKARLTAAALGQVHA